MQRILEGLYNLEVKEISSEEREFRSCIERELKTFVNNTLSNEYNHIKWIYCDVILSDKCADFMEWVMNARRKMGGYYDYISKPPVIVLRPDFGPFILFHEVVHHKQYIEAAAPEVMVFSRRLEHEARLETRELLRKYKRVLIKLIKDKCKARVWHKRK